MSAEKSWRNVLFGELTQGIEEALAISPDPESLVHFSVGDMKVPEYGYMEIKTSVAGLVALQRWLADGMRYMALQEPPATPVVSITDESEE